MIDYGISGKFSTFSAVDEIWKLTGEESGTNVFYDLVFGEDLTDPVLHFVTPCFTEKEDIY